MGLQAILGGLMAMFGWGGADFFAKNVVGRTGALKTLLWVQLFGAIPIGLAILIFQENFFSGAPMGLLGLFAVFDALGYWLFFRAIEKGKISIVGPVFSTYVVGAVLIANLFGGESFTSNLIAGMMLVFVGVVLTSVDPKEKISVNKINFVKQPGVLEALCGALVFSFWYPLWERFGESQADYVFANTLWLRLGVALTLLVIIGLIKEKVELKYKASVWKLLALAGLFDATAYVGLTWGYLSEVGTSVTTVLGSAYSLPTLVLARLFLKEKLMRIQKLGVAFILVGLMVVGLAS